MKRFRLPRRAAVLAAILPLMPCGCTGLPAPTSSVPGHRVVGKHEAEFTEPPRRLPTGAVVDGPILGNGDIGVAFGGPPERALFYIGKNDFWSHDFAKVITLGGLALEMPQLAGASYRQVQDLARAEVRGAFSTELTTLQTRTWTAEGENVLVTELVCEGMRPLQAELRLWTGALHSIARNDKPILVGCEQHGDNRFFFHGDIDEVRVYEAALSSDEVRDLAAGRRLEDALRLHWDFSEGQGQVAWDVAGAGNWGKPHGARWASGRHGWCLAFDGEDDYLDAGQLQIDRAVTVSAWVRAETLDTDEGQANYILSKGEWNEGFSLGLSQGKPRMFAGGMQVDAPTPIRPDTWTHVAGTFDGRQVRVFVDGRLVAETPEPVFPAAAGEKDGLLWVTRAANRLESNGRRAAVASRVVGAAAEAFADDAGAALRFEVAPGQTARLVSVILSDLDTKDGDVCRAAIERAAALTPEEIEQLADHRAEWWRDFWDESRVEINDPLIEKFYYGAHYIMASCSRSGEVAPGLFGNWITTDHPGWRGDYHLNYNHEAPWWGVYSSNHISISEPYEPPLMVFLPTAKEYARRFLDMPGSYFPVGIGPWGIHSDPSFWRQKSNGAYATTNMIMRWRHTYDPDYLRDIAYPFMISVADFWEAYLRFEDGRYMIYNDAIHEGQRGNINPILSLGLLRTLFQTLIDAGNELGVDQDRHAKWRHILDHLPEYPLQEREGKTVFRYTEIGMDWCDSNTLGIQHVFPSGAIGLDSDPDLLKIARDTLTVLNRWSDYNGYPTFYTAAARLGYDPEIILANMRRQMEHHSFPNLFIYFGGGGIETCGGTTSAINEMLLQSHEGVLRLFPVWPRNHDARFQTLRAVGAFLVSSALRNNTVRYVHILSERGRACSVVNPWETAVLWRDGRRGEVFSDKRFSFATRPGETVMLLPEGVEPDEVSPDSN